MEASREQMEYAIREAKRMRKWHDIWEPETEYTNGVEHGAMVLIYDAAIENLRQKSKTAKTRRPHP